MLSAERRLRRAHEFEHTVRRGARAGRTLVVVHAAAAPADGWSPARAGFVVDRRVGGAVVRNRVRRRLRHLMATRLERLPKGIWIVVRARPAAASASGAALARDLDAALARAVERTGAVR